MNGHASFSWPKVTTLRNFANIRLNSFPLNINTFSTLEKYLINLISGVKYVLTDVLEVELIRFHRLMTPIPISPNIE